MNLTITSKNKVLNLDISEFSKNFSHNSGGIKLIIERKIKFTEDFFDLLNELVFDSNDTILSVVICGKLISKIQGRVESFISSKPTFLKIENNDDMFFTLIIQ